MGDDVWRAAEVHPRPVATEKAPSRGAYGETVTRLEEIVRLLETGELTLEDSLERFAEGVTLVKQGESMLAEAERRVEQLLSDDGRTAPLKVPEVSSPTPAPTLQRPAAAAPQRPAPVKAPSPIDDDVPF